MSHKFVFFKNKIFWEHLPLSIFIGLMFLLLFGLWECLVLALLFGWLVDVDHLFDLILFSCERKRIPSFRQIESGEYFRLSQRVILPIHAFEWPIILLLLSLVNFVSFEQRLFFLCCGLSLFSHLLQDYLTNKTHSLSYFFIFRSLKRFNISALCK